jgi:hypothetical protein
VDKQKVDKQKADEWNVDESGMCMDEAWTICKQVYCMHLEV